MNRSEGQWDDGRPNLYHGTSAAITTGGMVDANKDKYAADGNPMAFATTSQRRAEKIAANKAADAGHLFGIVYKVGRVGKTTSMDDTEVSREGFKVKGVHKWVDNADLSRNYKQ